MLKTLLEDLSSQREGLLSQGFWALAVYRLGHARHGLRSPLLRIPLALLTIPLHKLCEICFGISISSMATIGRRLSIEHFSGIIIHGKAVIGDDCLLRQGVSIGNRHTERPHEAPRIGNRVEMGAGAKILGPVTIGDDARIGANAVVISDVPAGHVAVGVPARITPRTPRDPQ